MMIAAVLMTTGFILGAFYAYDWFTRKSGKEKVDE